MDGDGEDDGNDGGDDDEGDGESAYKKDLRLSYKGGFPNGVYQDKNIETEKDVNLCLCPREMTMTMFWAFWLWAMLRKLHCKYIFQFKQILFSI